jgi:hypothetical protein
LWVGVGVVWFIVWFCGGFVFVLVFVVGFVWCDWGWVVVFLGGLYVLRLVCLG